MPLVTATKTRLYNDAARLLADARLALITDDVETRYALDDAWDGAVAFVLGQAAWRFAVERALLGPGIVDIPEYTHSYGFPTNWLRTHKLILVAADGRECPVDVRERTAGIFANVANLTIEYISTDYLDPETTTWPEHFSKTLAAYLAFCVAERVTGEPNASTRMSQVFSQHLSEARRLEAHPDDPWLPFQRSGEMLRGAYDLLRRANWRFALAEVALDGDDLGPSSPFRYGFAKPNDWLRTYTLSVTGVAPHRPVDAREQGAVWYAQVPVLRVRHVSATLGINSLLWPETFRTALLSYLQAGMPQPRQDQQEVPQWQGAVGLAIAADAAPDDRWLHFQLDGTFDQASRAVLQQGYWSYRDAAGVMRGLKEVQYSVAEQLDAYPSYPYPYRYRLPEDWFKTHALFVPWDGDEAPINIRESAHDWSTDAETFVARYLSTEVLDAAQWPDTILDTVWAYCAWRSAPPDRAQALAQEFGLHLAAAKKAHSRPENKWLRFQLSGAFLAAVKMQLEAGRWRFALRVAELMPSSDPLPAELSTGAAEYSYAYRFIQPSDLLRTIRVYWEAGFGPRMMREDVAFADIGGAYHADMMPIKVRYVSRLGLDATKWPAHFGDTVLAELQYQEVRDDPAMASIAAAKLQLYKDASRNAEGVDDARDRAVIRGSRFVAAYRSHRIIDRTDFVPTFIGAPAILPPNVPPGSFPPGGGETGGLPAGVLTDEFGNPLTDEFGNYLVE